MARPCTICNHPERQAIDRALVAGVTANTVLSSQFAVTEQALRRHKAGHLPAALAQAQDAREVAQADDLLAQVKRLQLITMNVLKIAYDAQDLRTALQAVAQARQNLELVGRIVGELEAERVQVAVLVASPDWLRLRAVILAALDPYPAARQAVAEALRRAG